MISRRELLRRGAIVGTAVALRVNANANENANASANEAEKKLSPSSRAEADARHQAILRKHGKDLSAQEKEKLRAMSIDLQGALDAVRAFAIDPAVEPAIVFRPRR